MGPDGAKPPASIQGMTISGNLISASGGVGIAVDGPTDVRIEDNIIDARALADVLSSRA